LFGRREFDREALEQPIATGDSSVKIPEDFSATPAVINQHLVAADCGHFTIHLHTNSIDEFGICEVTIAAVERRTIHMFHLAPVTIIANPLNYNSP
jgi:urease subunit alpha